MRRRGGRGREGEEGERGGEKKNKGPYECVYIFFNCKFHGEKWRGQGGS